MIGSQDKTNSPTREIVQRAPSVSFNDQPLPRMIQQHRFSLTTIVEGDSKRAAKCYHQLTKAFVCMTATALASRYIVDPISPFDVERHYISPLGNSQVAAGVGNLGEIYQFYLHIILL